MILKLKSEKPSSIKKASSEEQIKAQNQEILSNNSLDPPNPVSNNEDSSHKITETDSTKARTSSKYGSVGRTETDMKIDIELPVKVEKSLIKLMKYNFNTRLTPLK